MASVDTTLLFLKCTHIYLWRLLKSRSFFLFDEQWGIRPSISSDFSSWQTPILAFICFQLRPRPSPNSATRSNLILRTDFSFDLLSIAARADASSISSFEKPNSDRRILLWRGDNPGEYWKYFVLCLLLCSSKSINGVDSINVLYFHPSCDVQIHVSVLYSRKLTITQYTPTHTPLYPHPLIQQAYLKAVFHIPSQTHPKNVLFSVDCCHLDL